ncbi:hypothetical protein PG989_004642 [Apiospora arundinis]
MSDQMDPLRPVPADERGHEDATSTDQPSAIERPDTIHSPAGNMGAQSPTAIADITELERLHAANDTTLRQLQSNIPADTCERHQMLQELTRRVTELERQVKESIEQRGPALEERENLLVRILMQEKELLYLLQRGVESFQQTSQELRAEEQRLRADFDALACQERRSR